MTTNKAEYATLKDALTHVATMQREHGMKIRMSRIAADKIKKPRTWLGKVFGVSATAEKFCKSVAPNGKWITHAEINSKGEYQFSIWYNDFTPYAIAMMECEDGFECMGIDFESINGFFGTVMGFYNVGMDFVKDEDGDLYSKIYSSCCEISPPSLPFYEMYTPAAVWCCLKAPKQFIKRYKDNPDCWILPKIKMVLEDIKMPIPEHLTKILKKRNAA